MGQHIRDEHGELEMSQDIVEQLRDSNYPGQEGMREEAAAEIEMLRAALAGMQRIVGAISIESESFAEIRANAKRMPVAEPGEPS